MSVTDREIEQFRDRIVGRRVKEQTASIYENWVRRFETWKEAGEPDLGALIDFDNMLADPQWTDYPWENAVGRPAPDEYAYRTRVKGLSGVKLWCRLNYDVDIREQVQNIASGEPDPFDPPYISENDVSQIVADAPRQCDCAGCEAALRLTYDAILRAAELTNIRRDQLDLEAGTLDVKAVKGSLNATLKLDGETVAALQRHISKNDVGDVIFTNTYGNPWKPSSWCSHFRKKHHEVGAHSFGRHSPIVHRLQSGESFGDVYRRARHSNPSMTVRYARLVGVDVPDWAGE